MRSQSTQNCCYSIPLLASDTTYKISHTTLSFNNSLERLAKLTESCFMYHYGLSQEGMQIKISQGKCTEQSQVNTKHRAFIPYPMDECITLMASMCDSMHGELPIRKAQTRLEVQSFYWGSIMCDDWLVDCPGVDLSVQVNSLCDSKPPP